MRGQLTSQYGFTLIEIMIVLAILAILVTVALPSYQSNVQKSRRADGHAALMELGALQERYYLKNGSYTTTIDAYSGLNYGATTSPDGFYNLSAAACSGGNIASCYVLTAAATGLQLDDDDCALMTLDYRTQRSGKNSSSVVNDECW